MQSSQGVIQQGTFILQLNSHNHQSPETDEKILKQKTEAISLITRFLRDLYASFRISLSIRRFKKAGLLKSSDKFTLIIVLTIQRAYRWHRYWLYKRIRQLKKQWDSIVENRIKALDEKIQFEEERMEKNKVYLQKMIELLKTKNLPQVKKFEISRKILFNLMGQREELKRIPE